MTPQKIKQILIELAEKDELPMDMNDLDESIFNESNEPSIKEQLNTIVAKMNSNIIAAWDGKLEDTTSALALEDHCDDPESEEPTTVYNGWFDDLSNLINKL